MKELTLKQKQFHKAMEKYNSQNYYQHIYTLVSILNLTMQLILLYILFSFSLPWYLYIVGFVIAYFLTDFINGLVHMYMDNNDDYNSIWGPFIASFHLHHQTQKYKDASILTIYFKESGAKFWLVLYLAVLLILSTLEINQFVLLVLIYIGILSSVAEVSHFLCHNSDASIVKLLQKYHILLSIEHHNKHHQKDNQSYAFLNGSSDFIIDKIAAKLYRGYQNGSDEHFECYHGKGTKNRD